MKLISAAFVKAQREFGPALKTNTNPHFRSKYADLASCVEAVIDALNNNGIALIQTTTPSDTGVIVETTFIHESGETINSGKLHVPAAKNDPQGFGSALTYARRYSLMAACGIAPEDDDGNAASQKPIKHSPRSGAKDILDASTKAVIEGNCADIVALISEGREIDAINFWYSGWIKEAEEAVYAFDQLDSKTRALIKANKPKGN